MLRWLSAVLVLLAILAGAGWWLQRQAAAELQGEIALLQDEHRELGRLRADNQRLAAALPPAAKLEAMRADHAGVIRLRNEIAALHRRIEQKEEALRPKPKLETVSAKPAEEPSAAAVPTTTFPVTLVAGTWKNAGQTTPTATLETVLWAGANGRVDDIAGALILAGGAMDKAQEIFDQLPAATQQDYGSPARMVATLMSHDMPTRDIHVADASSDAPGSTTAALDVAFATQGGPGDQVRFEFAKMDNRWGLSLSTKMVESLVSKLPGTAPTK